MAEPDPPGETTEEGKPSTFGQLYEYITGKEGFSTEKMDEMIAQVDRLKMGLESLSIVDQKRALSASEQLESLLTIEKTNELIIQRQNQIKELQTHKNALSKERIKLLDKEIVELQKIKAEGAGQRRNADTVLNTNRDNLKILRAQVAEHRRLGTELQRIENLYSKKIAPGTKAATGGAKSFAEEVYSAGKALSDLDPEKLLAEAPAENVWLKVLTGVEGVTFGSVYSELDGFTNKMDTGLRSVVKGGVSFSKDLKNVFVSAIDPIEMASGRQGYLSKQWTDNMGGMLVNIGADGEKAGTAILAVKNNVSLLRDSWISASPANQAAASHIVNLTLGLKHLGVAEEDTAKGFDFFMKGLGQSPKEASKSIRSLENIAHTLDINVGQAFKDFNALQGDLSQYGSQTVKVFGDLQAQAVTTGVAVGDLNKVAEKLDTFKGAATAAQHFNAIVGKTALSVTDLVHAEPAEKIQLLREAMDRSNISFDTAHRRIRKMIAGILGVDVAKASKIFGSPQDYFKLQKNLDGSASSMKALDKRIHQSMTNAEEMKSTLSSLGASQMEAVDGARENAVKASETMMTIIGSLGEKADTAKEILIGFRQALRVGAGAEAVVEKAAGVGVDVAGYITLGKIIWNSMGGSGKAKSILQDIEDSAGVDFFDIKEDGSIEWKTPRPGAPGGDKKEPRETRSRGRGGRPDTPDRHARALGGGTVVVNVDIPVEVHQGGAVVASAHIKRTVRQSLDDSARGKPQPEPVIIDVA